MLRHLARKARRLRGVTVSVALALLVPVSARAQVVQGCGPTAFLDVRAGNDASRQLVWDFSIVNNPRACLLIQVGQSIEWHGNLSVHPLTAQGGDTPNPIGFHEEGDVARVTFNSPGTFGYKCLAHQPMIGAVQVVQATVPPASGGTQAPALPLGLALGLAFGLLVAGKVLLTRRATR